MLGMNSRRALQARNHSSAQYNLRSQTSDAAISGTQSARLTAYFGVQKKRRMPVEEKDRITGSKRRCQRGLSVMNLNCQDAEFACSAETCLKYQPVTKQVQCTPLGAFNLFPPELRQSAFDIMPLDCLAKLCICSSTLSCEIRSYVRSGNAQRRFAEETANYSRRPKMSDVTDQFYCWGVLIRAATATFSTQDSLSLLTRFYEKNAAVNSAKGWGKLFFALYERTDFGKRKIFLNSILSLKVGAQCSKSGVVSGDSGASVSDTLLRLIDLVAEGTPGAAPEREMQVRQLLRGFFLDNCRYCNVNESAFWISAVIRTQKTAAARGRLLYVLYGPLTISETFEEVIDWRTLVDTAIASYVESIGILKPLSDALYFLANSKFLPGAASVLAWSETEMFNVIEELTTSPEPWSFDNFAALILHRPCLIPLTIVPRVLNGFVDEAGQLFNTIKTLVYRWRINGIKLLGQHMSYSMAAMPPFERRSFIASIHTAFSNQLHDHLATFPPAQFAFGEEIKAARSNSNLLKLLERFV